MCLIARHHFYPGTIATHVATIYFTTGVRVDLFPDKDDLTPIGWALEFHEIVDNLVRAFKDAKSVSE
jgi:hypothetical protein